MTLFDATGLNAGSTGTPYAVKRDERAYRPLQVTISGTANVDVQVRNGNDDDWAVLKNFTASEALMVAAFPQIRVVVNSATAATVRVSMGAILNGVA